MPLPRSEELGPPMDDATCNIVAEFFSVYSNPTRIHIFCGLRTGPKTVSELAEHAKVSLQNVSQHLRVMKDKGALTSEKRGQRVYYSVADAKFLFGVKMIRDALVEMLKRRAALMPFGAPSGSARSGAWHKPLKKKSA